MQAINKWHKTKPGHFVFGLAELAIAYGFASWAIDNGSLLLYALTIIFLVGGIRNWARIFKANDKQKAASSK